MLNTNSLGELNCSYNQITKLENLPDNLQVLWCKENQITKLSSLPRYLRTIHYDEHKIQFVDNLEFSWFNGKFNIKTYNILRRLQRRIRRNIKRNNDTRVFKNDVTTGSGSQF